MDSWSLASAVTLRSFRENSQVTIDPTKPPGSAHMSRSISIFVESVSIVSVDSYFLEPGRHVEARAVLYCKLVMSHYLREGKPFVEVQHIFP